MLKKIFCIILIISILAVPFTASAYEVTGIDITAKAGLLISLDTGEILYEKNIDQKVYPASITKIMTATIILENEKFDPNAKIAMSESALTKILGTGSVVSNLKAGEEISQLDLVYYILMSSAGDCVYLAAEYYAGSIENFVVLMNEKAKELGLTSTNYENPIGLHHENNYTSVRDIYTLATYSLKNSTFKEVCESARYEVPATNMSGPRRLSTTNFLQDTTTNYYYTYAHGVKTGFTDEAGRCLVSTASYNGYNYMCILMGCPNTPGQRHEFTESKDLYKWAFNNFEFKEVATSENPVCEVKVELSMERDFVPLYIEKGFISVMPKDADESTVIIEPKLKSDTVDAPVKKGQKLGTADIIYAEKVIGTVDLVAGDNISANTVLLIGRAIKNFFTSSYMKILYILIAIAILIFTVMVIRLNKGRTKKRKVKYIPYGKDKNDRR